MKSRGVLVKTLPACGPTSSTGFAMKASKWRVIASGLNLSHSRPRPGMGAGLVLAPVAVRPKRMIVQRPGGTAFGISIRYIGFSAHSEEAALAAMDRFDFDSILFPFSFPIWLKTEFGPSVYKRAKKARMGILALKAMAHQHWPTGKRHRWKKTFYEPFDEIDQAALGLRFTLHLPVTAMFPPGHWELFKMALDLAQAGALVPLNDDERKIIEKIARKAEPIFP